MCIYKTYLIKGNIRNSASLLYTNQVIYPYTVIRWDVSIFIAQVIQLLLPSSHTSYFHYPQFTLSIQDNATHVSLLIAGLHTSDSLEMRGQRLFHESSINATSRLISSVLLDKRKTVPLTHFHSHNDKKLTYMNRC